MDVEPSSDDILSTRDAAIHLGVSVRTIQLWVENGSLQAWKTPGGHRRIFRKSVDDMLAARKSRERGASVPGDVFEILICEDNALNCSLLEMQLRTLGSDVRIRTVTNGFSALIQIGDCCPNVLIANLVLPNMDGMQMLTALQSAPFMQTMNIIVVTDLNDEQIEQRGGLPPGITRFTKPIRFPQMLRLIRVYMDISKSQRK